MKHKLSENADRTSIFLNLLIAAVSLFFNGFGIYLTIHANIGAGPWDVFTLGLSKSLGILYGTASIGVSFTILAIDILMHESIGLAMVVDSIVVGKSVDFFNYLDIVPPPRNMAESLLMMTAGMVILGYTEFFYMRAALGCGPRDTLLVGLKRRMLKVPLSIISIALLSVVTLIGYLLGGKVGIGTLYYAFADGPIMQLTFRTVGFDVTKVRHQNFYDSIKVLIAKKS